MSIKNISIKTIITSTFTSALISAFTLAFTLALPVKAEDAPINTQINIDELIVTGSRTLSGSALTTSVPIDLFGRQELAATSQIETGRAIQALAPSFNFPSTSIADGTDSLKPATLRGLGPDQTLVLVNGLRRHKSALLHVNQSVGRGTAGTDMNAIPPSFVGGVEILRDGAAALYGSDAIAGVINIKLRESTGGEMITSYGKTIRGDGEQARLALNYGFDLPSNGFLFMGYEVRDSGASDRSGLSGTLLYTAPAGSSDPATCHANDNSGCDPREHSVNRQNFIIGDPETLQNGWIINSGIDTGPIQWRGFMLLSSRDNKSTGYFREPDDDNRNVLAIYGDGFLPEINTAIDDSAYSLAASTQLKGWNLELAGVRGQNKFDFYVSNSLNASFGDDSPRGADSGGVEYGEDTINFNATRHLAGFDIAAGAEWKHETYKIRAGEVYSYASCHDLSQAARLALGDDGVCAFQTNTASPKAGGIQVFPGFSPQNARDASRDSFGIYAEASRTIAGFSGTDSFSGTAAVRWEKYDGFDNVWSGRLGGRYEINRAHAFRGSVSNGFRAPSLHQKHFNTITTQAVGGVLIQTGHFTNDSALVRGLGVPTLQEETSLNYSVGYVLTPNNNFSLTLDAYQIDIDDRIILSKRILRNNLNPSTDQAIINVLDDVDANGVAGNNQVAAAQFMLNGPQTRTRGLEVVAHWQPYTPDWLKGALTFRGSGHYAQTDVQGTFAPPGLLSGLAPDDIFGVQERTLIEDWQPKHRIALTTQYEVGDFTITGVVNHYGSYQFTESSAQRRVQTFSAAFVADIRVNWQPIPSTRITLYGNNIFDQYPEANNIETDRAGTIAGIVDSPNGVQRYSRRTLPYGFNGAFWGIQIKHNF